MTPIRAMPIDAEFWPTTEEQGFWQDTFQSAIALGFLPEYNTGKAGVVAKAAANLADASLEEWRHRWRRPEQKVKVPAIAQTHVEFTLEMLDKAQSELELAQQHLEACEKFRDKMPDPDLAEAWFNVEGTTAKKRVESAQSWVKNVQENLEKQGPSQGSL